MYIEVKKAEKVKEVKPPKSRFAIKILADVEHEKLAQECKICKRLKYNGGSCGGRVGMNICLAFIESPGAKLREETIKQARLYY